ncbi:MAG: type II secretion system F family protein [Gemmatimonadetes bacterium]|nr:type II secretion system F family protein [Gemmatimonadota bacterium]
MPGFEYRAIDRAGRRARGEAVAIDAATLQRELEQRGLTVLDVAERSDNATRAGDRVPHAALEDAMRALAALLPAGMAIGQSLDAAGSTSPPALRARLLDIRARVERGESLATAFAAHGDVFSPAMVGIIRAGERAGDLDAAFARLADQLERQGALRARLLSAAIYPALLAVVGGAAVLVLLLFVLPRFAALLGDTGAALPTSTRLLLGAASAARRNWFIFPVLALAATALGAWLRLTAEGRRAWARTLLTLPLVGAFRRETLAAECARLIAVLLKSGASLISALDDAALSVADPLAREALVRVRERVRAGGTLHGAIAEESVFPPLLASLVATGEEAGRLQDFLGKAAELFEVRTERGAQRLVAIAEPAMIVLFGAMVGLVALSLLQAIYGVNPAALR